MSEKTLSILVKAVGTAKAAKDLKGVDAVVSNIGAKTGKGVRTAATNLVKLGTVAAGVAAAGLVASVKAAGDFEASLNTINTIARATPAGLEAIGTGIRDLAKKTGSGLGDLETAYYDLLSAGIKTADAQNVLTQANTLAIGGLATTAETVDLLTTAINAYGGDATKAAGYTDDFAKAIELGKVTAADIAASFADVGAIAAQSGIQVKEIAAAYGFLTAQGVPAAEVTTQMSRAILELQKPSAAVEKLQRKLGKNYADLARQKGLVPALQELRDDAGKAGVGVQDLFGRVEGYKFLLETTGDKNAGFNDVIRQMGDDAGTAAGQMAERQKGLNFQLGRLKALAIDAAITIGNKLLPKITPLAEKAVAFLDTHQADISAFGDKIASAFDKALSFAEKIPWDQVGAGLKTAADWAGKLFDAFLHLPPEFQSTLIALAGLNKLTGGAITGIVGALGSGLIKGVLGMNAGVVNINAGVVNGGGGVPGGAGAGGLAAGARGVLGYLGIVGLTVGAGQIIADSIGATEKNPVSGASRAGYRQENPGKTPGSFAASANANKGGLSPDERQAFNDQKRALDKVYDGLEKNRLAIVQKLGTTASYQAQQTAAAIRDIRIPAPVVNVNAYTSVSVRDVAYKTKVSLKYGRVVS